MKVFLFYLQLSKLRKKETTKNTKKKKTEARKTDSNSLTIIYI